MATPSTVMPGRVSVADQRLSIARRFDEHDNLADGTGKTTAEVTDANESVAQSMQDMQTDMLRTSAGQYVRGAIGGSLHADLVQLLTIDLSIDSNTDAEHQILMEKINTFVEHQLDVIEVNGDEFTSLQAQLMETKMKEIEEATNLLSSLAIGSHPAPTTHPNDGMTDSERADHQIRTDQFAANTRELHALYHEVATAEGIKLLEKFGGLRSKFGSLRSKFDNSESKFDVFCAKVWGPPPDFLMLSLNLRDTAHFTPV